MRISQSKLAAQLGLSQTTVSRALKGDNRIRPEVISRIKTLAKELEYRPDPLLSIRASKRWDDNKPTDPLVAFLLNSNQASGTPPGWLGVEKRCRDKGYLPEIMNLLDYGSSSRLLRVLRARGIRRLILGGIAVDGPQFDLPWKSFVVVACGIGFLDTPFHTVCVDHFQGLHLASRKLVERGYRRLGYVLFKHQPLAVEDVLREAALLYLSRESGEAAPIPPYYLRPDSKPETLKEGLRAWMKKYRPDGIVTTTFGIYWDLLGWGYRVPEDVGLLSLFHSDGVASVGVKDEVLGKAAIDLMEQESRDCHYGAPEHRMMIKLQPEWENGPTIRNHPSA